MGLPPPPTPSALPIRMEEAPPSISRKESSDVQATIRSLWPHTRARNALSESGASLGRPHRFGARAGEKLAADGLWFPDPIGRARSRYCLAIDPRYRYALGG